MAPLTRNAVALTLLIAAPARADGGRMQPSAVANWRPLIFEASQRFGVPVEWIERVMDAESDGRTMLDGRPIRSRAGAIGLMQLMPATWQAMRQALRLGPDPDDPRDNILAGTFYLRLLYDRFGYPGLFAAYNAGPRRYADHLATGSSLPAETLAYLDKLGAGGAPFSPPREAKGEPLFAVRYSPAPRSANRAATSVSPSLFAVRHDGF